MSKKGLDAAAAVAALDAAPIGIWLVGGDGVVHWVNQALAGFLEVPEDDLTGRVEQELLTRHFMSSGDNHSLLQLLAGPTDPDRWFLNVAQPLDGEQKARYFVEVTEMLNLRAECDRLSLQLENAATSDAMTGLLNQRALIKALEPQVSRSRRYNNPLSVVAMALRGYRAEGVENRPDESQVVTAIAYFLRDQLRWVDSIGRTGDKEFMLILPETSLADAEKLIGKLRARLDAIPFPDDPQLKLSVEMSFGAASWQKGDDVSLLLARVKEALNAAQAETA